MKTRLSSLRNIKSCIVHVLEIKYYYLLVFVYNMVGDVDETVVLVSFVYVSVVSPVAKCGSKTTASSEPKRPY